MKYQFRWKRVTAWGSLPYVIVGSSEYTYILQVRIRDRDTLWAAADEEDNWSEWQNVPIDDGVAER